MPSEKRDVNSGARIFVPTIHEKTQLQQSREINKQLAELKKLKEDISKMMEKVDKEDK